MFFRLTAATAAAPCVSKMRLAVTSFAAAAALGFWLQAASATTLYDNISATPGGLPYQAAPYSPSNPGNTGPLYDSFSTLGSTFSLSQFDLLIGATNPSDGGGFGIAILNDSGSNSPGTAFYTSGLFSDSFIPTANTPYDVNFSFATQTLAANSRYWIELFATGSVNWYWSFDESGTGVLNEYWAFTEQNGNIGVIQNGGPFQMLVTDAPAGGATPLPATLPLFAGGLGIIGLLGARKRRNAQAA